jgi:2-polyprenyl-3-methyl-5-hydroxy-6-metoxy-1,4-benzoquinol methylase
LLISDEYRALNAELHKRAEFGISGAKWALIVATLANHFGCDSILDYGCGRGTLKRALLARGVTQSIAEYDPAIPEKAELPEPADLVVCGDVLEHIEPDCLDAVLDHLRELTRRVAFLVVATRPAKKILADGRNAHLIVENARWWAPRLMARWHMWELHSSSPGEFDFTGVTDVGIY